MSNIDWKKVIEIVVVTIGTAFVVTSIVAKIKKESSTYEDKPEEKNPMESKKVVFIEDENDKENADGIKGHLEAVGESEPHKDIYASI